MVTTRSQHVLCIKHRDSPSYKHQESWLGKQRDCPPYKPQESWCNKIMKKCGHECALVTFDDKCCGCERRGKQIRGYCPYCK